jgi:hypothetical protein
VRRAGDADLDLNEFIESKCLVQIGLSERLTDLYRSYRQWTDARGEPTPSLPAFQLTLMAAGFRQEVVDGRGVLHGISLNAPPEGEISVAKQAICSRCHGTDWGPSGRYTEDGAEVWHCTRCAATGR